MVLYRRFPGFCRACISVGILTGLSAAAHAGDVIAGQQSPWASAHFVLAAYSAILIGVVLYVLRLAGMANRIRREMDALREAMESGSPDQEI